MRINNIDGKDPGKLYGTITINNGLDTQYIYNRTKENYQIIKPGEDALLTGPDEAISAFGSFVIELLLKPWDDVIIRTDISWDASDIGNVYPCFKIETAVEVR